MSKRSFEPCPYFSNNILIVPNVDNVHQPKPKKPKLCYRVPNIIPGSTILQCNSPVQETSLIRIQNDIQKVIGGNIYTKPLEKYKIPSLEKYEIPSSEKYEIPSSGQEVQDASPGPSSAPLNCHSETDNNLSAITMVSRDQISGTKNISHRQDGKNSPIVTKSNVSLQNIYLPTKLSSITPLVGLRSSGCSYPRMKHDSWASRFLTTIGVKQKRPTRLQISTKKTGKESEFPIKDQSKSKTQSLVDGSEKKGVLSSEKLGITTNHSLYGMYENIKKRQTEKKIGGNSSNNKASYTRSFDSPLPQSSVPLHTYTNYTASNTGIADKVPQQLSPLYPNYSEKYLMKTNTETSKVSMLSGQTSVYPNCPDLHPSHIQKSAVAEQPVLSNTYPNYSESHLRNCDKNYHTEKRFASTYKIPKLSSKDPFDSDSERLPQKSRNSEHEKMNSKPFDLKYESATKHSISDNLPKAYDENGEAIEKENHRKAKYEDSETKNRRRVVNNIDTYSNKKKDDHHIKNNNCIKDRTTKVNHPKIEHFDSADKNSESSKKQSRSASGEKKKVKSPTQKSKLSTKNKHAKYSDSAKEKAQTKTLLTTSDINTIRKFDSKNIMYQKDNKVCTTDKKRAIKIKSVVRKISHSNELSVLKDKEKNDPQSLDLILKELKSGRVDDLRNKLSRRTLSKNFEHESKSTYNRNAELKRTERENVIISVPNKTDKNHSESADERNKSKSSQKKTSSKSGKEKKIKLVINIQYHEEESTSEESDDTAEKYPISDSTNSDLSFLDNLNIDEIVRCLENSGEETRLKEPICDAPAVYFDEPEVDFGERDMSIDVFDNSGSTNEDTNCLKTESKDELEEIKRFLAYDLMCTTESNGKPLNNLDRSKDSRVPSNEILSLPIKEKVLQHICDAVNPVLTHDEEKTNQEVNIITTNTFADPTSLIHPILRVKTLTEINSDTNIIQQNKSSYLDSNEANQEILAPKCVDGVDDILSNDPDSGSISIRKVLVKDERNIAKNCGTEKLNETTNTNAKEVELEFKLLNTVADDMMNSYAETISIVSDSELQEGVNDLNTVTDDMMNSCAETVSIVSDSELRDTVIDLTKESISPILTPHVENLQVDATTRALNTEYAATIVKFVDLTNDYCNEEKESIRAITSNANTTLGDVNEDDDLEIKPISSGKNLTGIVATVINAPKTLSLSPLPVVDDGQSEELKTETLDNFSSQTQSELRDGVIDLTKESTSPKLTPHVENLQVDATTRALNTEYAATIVKFVDLTNDYCNEEKESIRAITSNATTTLGDVNEDDDLEIKPTSSEENLTGIVATVINAPKTLSLSALPVVDDGRSEELKTETLDNCSSQTQKEEETISSVLSHPSTSSVQDDDIKEAASLNENTNRPITEYVSTTKENTNSSINDDVNSTSRVVNMLKPNESENPHNRHELIESKNMCLAEKDMAKRLEHRMFIFFFREFTITDLIRKGRFSKIYKCEESTGENYAIKIMDERHVQGWGSKKKYMFKNIQHDIPKQNLSCVYIIDGFYFENKWCLLMEYCSTNLFQVLNESTTPLHIIQVQIFSRQLVNAVAILRNKKIVHSDIKPIHILLNSAGALKLSGFDNAYYHDDNKCAMLSPNTGAPTYRAPEIIMGHSAGYSIDVWATAVVMYEMATKRTLVSGIMRKSNNEILYRLMCILGDMPHEMIYNSTYRHEHFYRHAFFRKIDGCLIPNFLRGHTLHEVIQGAYHRDWFSQMTAKERERDFNKLYLFEKLLEKMLVWHPQQRLPIEFVHV